MHMWVKQLQIKKKERMKRKKENNEGWMEAAE